MFKIKRLIKKFVKALAINKAYVCTVFNDDKYINRLINDCIDYINKCNEALMNKKPFQLDLIEFITI
jgi:hypothetical protein